MGEWAWPGAEGENTEVRTLPKSLDTRLASMVLSLQLLHKAHDVDASTDSPQGTHSLAQNGA